jgi:hypothetical protein
MVGAVDGLIMHKKQETGITVNLISRMYMQGDEIFLWKRRRYVTKWELSHP